MRKIKGKKKRKLILFADKRFKKKLKRKNIKYGEKKNPRNYINKKIQNISKLKAPNNFSFLNNTEEVLKYFSDVENMLKKGNNVYFDLKDIDFLGFETIVLLMTRMADKNFTNNNICGGNEPIKIGPKSVFLESGFLQLVKSTRKVIPKNNGKMIQHISNKKVSTKISENICLDVINYTFKGKKYIDLHPILIECMSNTNNHAGFGTKNEYNWWLSYYKEPKTGITKICFIDLGVGICSSMNSRWKNIWENLGIFTNIEKFKELIDESSNFNLSRTKRAERGKGLRAMNVISKNKEVNNFIIISNSIYANLSTNTINKMKTSFKGTFIYWELFPN